MTFDFRLAVLVIILISNYFIYLFFDCSKTHWQEVHWLNKFVLVDPLSDYIYFFNRLIADNIRCLVEKVPNFGQIFSVLWPLDQDLNRDPQKVAWRD
ncbi:MAG: hypothetical protein AN486_05990 [Anabaena sp. AL93]|nr:MAG: hypothetical protein AN486_05990 [Anabaena sp. AL93]